MDPSDSTNNVDYYQYLCTDTPKVALTFDGSANRYLISDFDFNAGTVSTNPGETMCSASIQGQDNNIGITGKLSLKSIFKNEKIFSFVETFSISRSTLLTTNVFFLIQ